MGRASFPARPPLITGLSHRDVCQLDPIDNSAHRRDQATAGTFAVVVTNPSPGGGASNTVNFKVKPLRTTYKSRCQSGAQHYYTNGLFASVEVCEPGSTTNCTTVPNVLVDTGSTGLRLLSGAVSGLTLPAVTDSSGNDVQECIQFISTGVHLGAGRRSGYSSGRRIRFLGLGPHYQRIAPVSLRLQLHQYPTAVDSVDFEYARTCWEPTAFWAWPQFRPGLRLSLRQHLNRPRRVLFLP